MTPSYLTQPDEILHWEFAEVLPEVRAHILHELEPELLREIDEMMELPLDDPEGLRKLAVEISPTKYDGYDFIQELEAYINCEAKYDKICLSILTLKEEVINEEGATGTLNTPSDIKATLSNLSLITTQEANQPPVQRLWALAYAPHPNVGQDDEEFTFLLDTLQKVRSMRPAASALGVLAAGATIAALDEEPLDIILDADHHDGETENKYDQRRYVQNCLDHIIKYVQAVASGYCSNKELADALASTCEEILGQELLGYTFVVEGRGIESSQYVKNGPNPLNTPGDLHFEMAERAPISPDLFADSQRVVFQGVSVDVRPDENGFKVVPILTGRLVNKAESYPLINPVSSHIAAVVTKYDFCAVRLDGSAEITEVHLYDRKKFASVMEQFSQKLVEAPDLKPVYEKLLEIEDQFITEDDELKTFTIEPFQQIGELCGGDEVGCLLATDALSALFGTERIVKLNGLGRDTKANTVHKFDNLVKISSVISTHHSLDVEEPMLAFEVVDNESLSDAVHVMSLRDLSSIAI